MQLPVQKGYRKILHKAEEKQMKRTKGISLIVLVVTIIVMIIIAGAIILSLTQTNVIDQAENAVQKHNEASEKDILTLAWGEYMASLISNPAAELKVEGATVTGNGTNGWTVTFTTGSKYTVSAKGEITKAGMQEEPDIDDERVVEILIDSYSGTIDEKTATAEIKKELNIKNVEGNSFVDISFNFTGPSLREEIGYIYFYTIDRLYLSNSSNMQIEYVSKEENETIYIYAAKLEQIRQELETAFVGKTVTEIQEKHTGGTLKQYILDNCSSINTIDIAPHWWEDAFITSISFEYGNSVEEDLGAHTQIGFIIENGIYTGISIYKGS